MNKDIEIFFRGLKELMLFPKWLKYYWVWEYVLCRDEVSQLAKNKIASKLDKF